MYFKSSWSSLSEIFSFSDLSKIERRYTVDSETTIFVINLAPPDFPLPLDEIAIRNL